MSSLSRLDTRDLPQINEDDDVFQQLSPTSAARLRKSNLGSSTDADEAGTMLRAVQATSRYFNNWASDEIEELAHGLAINHFEKDEVILQAGEEGSWVGLLLEGDLAVKINGTEVAVFTPGVFVGEMCLWFGGTRQGDVVAKTSGVIATVLFAELREWTYERPQLSFRLLKACGQQSIHNYIAFRKRQQGLPDDHPPITAMPNVSAGEISAGWNKLCAHLKRSDSRLSDATLALLFDACTVRRFKQGQVLVREGDKVNFVLMLLEGKIAANVPQPGVYAAPELVCEFGFFEEDDFRGKLEISAVSDGIAAVMAYEDMQRFLCVAPDLLYSMVVSLGQAAMSHAQGKDADGELDARASTRRPTPVKAASGAAMETFYRKRLETERSGASKKKEKDDVERKLLEGKSKDWSTRCLKAEKELKVVAAQAEKLRQENERLKRERARDAKLASDNVALTKMLADANRQGELEQKEGRLLDAFRAKSNALGAEVADAKLELEQARLEAGRVTAEKLRLERMLNDSQRFLVDDELKLSAARTEAARDREELRAARKKIAAHDAVLEDLENELAQLRRELESGNHEMQRHKTSLDERRRRSLANKSTSLFALKLGSQAALTQPKTMAGVAALQEKANQLADDNAQLAERQQALESSNEAMADRAVQMGEERRQLEKQLGMADELLEPAIAGMRRLQRERATLEQRIAQLGAANGEEAKLRGQLARLSLRAHDGLVAMHAELARLAGPPPPGGFNLVQTVSNAAELTRRTLQEMQDHAPFASPKAPPLLEQLRLFTELAGAAEQQQQQPKQPKQPKQTGAPAYVVVPDAASLAPSPRSRAGVPLQPLPRLRSLRPSTPRDEAGPPRVQLGTPRGLAVPSPRAAALMARGAS